MKLRKAEDYKSSGKSLKGFAEKRGIPSSTLQGRLKEEQNLTQEECWLIPVLL